MRLLIKIQGRRPLVFPFPPPPEKTGGPARFLNSAISSLENIVLMFFCYLLILTKESHGLCPLYGVHISAAGLGLEPR